MYSASYPAYGITTYFVNVGLSAVIGLSAAPHVAYTDIRAYSGGTLFIGGLGAVHGTLLAAGFFMSTTNLVPLRISGPAGVAFVAAGATAVVHVLQGLKEGYTGQLA